jgi:hypothetical protein
MQEANADTVLNAAIQLRLGPLFVSVENWRRSQPKIPSRAEAVRLLVERALGEPERRTSSHSK